MSISFKISNFYPFLLRALLKQALSQGRFSRFKTMRNSGVQGSHSVDGSKSPKASDMTRLPSPKFLKPISTEAIFRINCAKSCVIMDGWFLSHLRKTSPLPRRSVDIRSAFPAERPSPPRKTRIRYASYIADPRKGVTEGMV